jgi:pimeloyl-ACP methyl ester carboxylesterase
MTPAKYSEFLASRIPNARLVLVEDAGHFVMVEKPAAVNQALVDWLADLSP